MKSQMERWLCSHGRCNIVGRIKSQHDMKLVIKLQNHTRKTFNLEKRVSTKKFLLKSLS